MKYQYTIEGKVIQGPGIDDSAGYLLKLGIKIGSPVCYTFIIDLSAPGFIKMSDGTIHFPPQPPYEFFYVKYISGTTLTFDTYISSHNSIVEQNYGHPEWLGLYPPNGERHIYASKGNNYLELFNMLQQPGSKDCWSVGSSFGCGDMHNIIYDASGKKSKFNFDAKITEIWQQI